MKIMSGWNNYSKKVIHSVSANTNYTANIVIQIEQNGYAIEKQSTDFNDFQKTNSSIQERLFNAVIKIEESSNRLIKDITDAEVSEIPKRLKRLESRIFNGLIGYIIIAILYCSIQIWFFKSISTEVLETNYNEGYTKGREEVVLKVNTFLEESPEANDLYNKWEENKNED